MESNRKILLVDLNNFGRYPTIPIGYLAAVLRRAGTEVSVFSPLAIGVEGVTRENRPTRFSVWVARANFLFAMSANHWIRRARNKLARRHLSEITAQITKVTAAFEMELQRKRPRLVMISTYLMYKEICTDICRICRNAGIPVLVGGPYFAQSEIVEQWIGIEGLTAIAAGEMELEIPQIADALIGGEDLTRFRGLFVADKIARIRGSIAPPLQSLDAMPIPDYSDFPWSAYPKRIVPVITGRGCAWGACTFCSDVTSTAGRTFRSRSPELVLEEIAHHYNVYGARQFVFTDLKLNGNLAMWKAIGGGMQKAAPGSTWIGAVHVGTRSEQGLSKSNLKQAADSGCVRLTTGLESGSQRVINAMAKGTTLSNVSEFLHDASDAGISCRCTMVLGYPGETAEDVDSSTEFLERHRTSIERVSLNRLQIITGTSLHRLLKRRNSGFNEVKITHEAPDTALVEHENKNMQGVAYRLAVMKLLGAVDSVNRQPLSQRAQEFEGVM